MSRGLDLAAELATADRRGLLIRAVAAGPLVIRVCGVSMRPWLEAGDEVRLGRRAPRRGDVALVVVRGRLVLHRLVRESAGCWLVRGDARARPDGWVEGQAVLAVALARRRGREAGKGWQPLGGPVARAGPLVGAPLLRALRRLRAASGSILRRALGAPLQEDAAVGSESACGEPAGAGSALPVEPVASGPSWR